jgi:polygalacturonase
MRLAALTMAALLTAPVLAQSPSTVATGDSRAIVQPSFPPTCATVQATKYIRSTNAVNIDPYNPTCGSTGGTNGTLGCTGGTDYQPSSSNASYVAAETLDNTAIQNALNSCTSGDVVELIPGSSGQQAFVLAPITLPAGVGLLVDSGIAVFASRNLPDWGGTNCGIITNSSSHNCNPWISAAGAGSGIYGYGTFYGRSWDAWIGQTTAGFYANRIQAYCNVHGGAIEGSPNCHTNGAGNNSYGPDGFRPNGASNFTWYKATLRDSGDFLANVENSTGVTFWSAWLLAPFEVSNTDGLDPLNSTNVTFTHGGISTGDNCTALKATSGATSNITLSYSQIGACIGIALGSSLTNGISNFLVTNVVKNGNSFRTNDTGLQITSGGSGSVNVVTYNDVCMMNANRSMQFISSGSTTIQNLLFQNITVLPSTAPYPTGNSGTFNFQGVSGLPIGMQVNNVQIQGTNQGGTDKYASVYLGPGTVDSSLLSQFAAGTGVTTAGTPSSTPAYTCNVSLWKPLNGNLTIDLPAGPHNNQSVTNAGPLTLKATVQPTTAINSKESAALTAGVQFYDNGAAIGSPIALSGDNTLAAYAVASVPSGTNNYTACYVGDSNYSQFCFGAVTAINGSPSPPNPSTATGNVQFSGNILWQ